MDIMGTVILFYLIIINIIGISMMGIDKKKAIKGAWRISERSFFIVSALGGSAGCWAGMYIFRHKTKHWYFVIGIPLILLIQIGISIMIIKGMNV